MASRSALALVSVRERVHQHISVPVSDAEALKICFTCATVESDALLELSHSRIVRAEASTHSRTLAVSPDEFATLLGDDSLTSARRYSMQLALEADELDAERQQQLESIRAALKLTLNEPAQHELWASSARVRMRVALAILRKDAHVECLKHALGEVLGSDLRRVDDLRCETEAAGIDIMSVAALISTTCSHVAS